MTKQSASIANLNGRDVQKLDSQEFTPTLRELAALERVSSRATLHTAAAQIEAYDDSAVRPWRETFARLSHPAAGVTGTGPEFTQAAQRFFDLIPNCHFKRFQEAFCPPERIVVPLAGIDVKDGKTFPKGNFRWNELSVAGCLPRADFIPDELALKLGGLTAEDYALAPEARMNTKGRVDRIARLKLVWDRLVPLSPDIRSDADARIRQRDLRALRVGSLGSSRNVVLPHQPDIEALVGTVLYVQGISGTPTVNVLGPREVHKKIVLFYGDIYSAHRRAGHEAVNAANETEKLADVQGALVTTSHSLNSGWKKPMTDELRKVYTEDVTEVSRRTVRALGEPRDELKVSARAHASRVSDSRDSSGKLNPAVTANGLATAHKRIGARRDRISRIASWNRVDGLNISGTIHEQEGLMRDLHAKVLKGAAQISNRTALFATRELSDRMVDVQVKTIKEKLGFSSETLTRLTVRPFVTFARALEPKFAEFELVAKDRNVGAELRLRNSQRVIDDVEAIFRVYQALRLIEHIRQEADSNPPPLLREVAAKIEQVQKHLERPLRFSRSSERSPVLADVGAKCEKVRSLLPKDVSDRYSAEERNVILRDAKKALIALDIEDIFQKSRALK